MHRIIHDRTRIPEAIKGLLGSEGVVADEQRLVDALVALTAIGGAERVHELTRDRQLVADVERHDRNREGRLGEQVRRRVGVDEDVPFLRFFARSTRVDGVVL